MVRKDKHKSKEIIPPAPCKLCGQMAALLDSHILSEFIYERLYDEKHRAVSVAADGTGKFATIQKGLRERLLCQGCETHFSKFEGHAAKVLRSMAPRLRGAAAGSVITEPGEYASLKLFLLSILWRASIASDPSFRAADLGAFGPKLHEMLQPGRYVPGPVTFLPCFAVAPSGLAEFDRTIGPAGRGELQGVPAVWLTFFGIHWFFVLTELSAMGNMPDIAATHRGLTVGIGSRSEAEELKRIGIHTGFLNAG